MDELLGRRDFTRTALGSILAWSFLDAVTRRQALGSTLRPVFAHWLSDLDQLCRDVKGQKVKQVDWQAKVEELFSKVDVADFLKMIDFEALAKKSESYKGLGAQSLTPKFPAVEGVPSKFVFGYQVFALKKDRSIVPHGHNNMATCFLVIKGQLQGRHYERLENHKEHLVIKPTIDKEFGPGGTSSISDQKDNIHWFKALSESAFVFNIHVLGVTPGQTLPTGRVYCDPNGEKLEGGKIRARLIGHDEADKLYG